MDRRTAVALCGSLGLVGVSGCLGVFGDGSDAGDSPDNGDGSDSDESDSNASPPEGYVRPEGDPEVVPAEFRCPDEEFTRYPHRYSPGYLHHGDTEKFALRVSDRSFEYGDTAEIILRNVHSEPAGTGNPAKYNLEIYTEAGWTDVRGFTDLEPPITDDLFEHDPGEGFTWGIELTEEGITEWHPESAFLHEDPLQVCPDLVSGRYRFVFWGVPDGETGVDDGVAVEFDLAVE